MPKSLDLNNIIHLLESGDVSRVTKTISFVKKNRCAHGPQKPEQHLVDNLVHQAFLLGKIDFLMELFKHPDTKDTVLSWGHRRAIMESIGREDFPLLCRVLAVLDTENLTHPKSFLLRQNLHHTFKDACRFGKPQIARDLLSDPKWGPLIDPLGRKSDALLCTVERDFAQLDFDNMYKKTNVLPVVCEILLPLYQDDDLNDIDVIQNVDIVLLDRYFHAFSQGKKDLVAGTYENQLCKKHSPDDFPHIKAYLEKKILKDAVKNQSDGANPRQPRAF